jgi:hypothetical protein
MQVNISLNTYTIVKPPTHYKTSLNKYSTRYTTSEIVTIQSSILSTRINFESRYVTSYEIHSDVNTNKAIGFFFVSFKRNIYVLLYGGLYMSQV